MRDPREIVYSWYRRLETREHRLRYLFLEITRTCNLQCRHCGSDCTASSAGRELTTQQWIDIIHQCRKDFDRDLFFVITGGEPLCHPDLEILGREIALLGMQWGMVTNGYALTSERMTKLIDAGLRSITLSLDGTESSHTFLRGRQDAYQRALAALKLIAASSIRYKDVVTCVYPGSKEELPKVAKLLIDTRMPAWRLFRIFPSGRARHDPALQLTPEQTRWMYEWIRSNRPLLARRGLRLNASCEGWLPFALDRQVRDQPFFCRAGVSIAGILADGTMTGCTNNSPAFHVGSVLDTPLKKLWETKFGSFRNRAWVKESGCRDCRHVKWCEGGSIHQWDEKRGNPKFCLMSSI